jgi:hypothetical protein
MDFPVTDAFKPGKSFHSRLDRSFRAPRRSNDDRALATVEKLIVSGNIIDETYAVARHLSPSRSAGQMPSWLGDCPALMIWINFGARGRQRPTGRHVNFRLRHAAK